MEVLIAFCIVLVEAPRIDGGKSICARTITLSGRSGRVGISDEAPSITLITPLLSIITVDFLAR